jgi:hypothetical protein
LRQIEVVSSGFLDEGRSVCPIILKMRHECQELVSWT